MTTNTVKKADAATLQRLIRASKSNRDVYDRLHYLCPEYIRQESHFIALDGQKIIAAASTEQSPFESDVIWLKHVSVDPRYRGQGHAKDLIRAVFNDAANAGKILEPSSFSAMGWQFLKASMPVIHTKEFPDLKVRWGTGPAPMDGYKPYALYEQSGQRKVRFL